MLLLKVFDNFVNCLAQRPSFEFDVFETTRPEIDSNYFVELLHLLLNVYKNCDCFQPLWSFSLLRGFLAVQGFVPNEPNIRWSVE